MSTQVPRPAKTVGCRDEPDACVAGATSAAVKRAATRNFLPLSMEHGSRVNLLQLSSRVSEPGLHLAQVSLAVAPAQLGIAREADDRGRDRVDVVAIRDEL